MAFSMLVSAATDKSAAQVETPDQQSKLRAHELEQLITILSKTRGSINPPVAQPGTVLQGALDVDAMSPQIDLALVPGSQPLVVVAVAFPGLGVRTISLSRAEARALANRLAAHAA